MGGGGVHRLAKRAGVALPAEATAAAAGTPLCDEVPLTKVGGGGGRRATPRGLAGGWLRASRGEARFPPLLDRPSHRGQPRRGRMNGVRNSPAVGHLT